MDKRDLEGSRTDMTDESRDGPSWEGFNMGCVFVNVVDALNSLSRLRADDDDLNGKYLDSDCRKRITDTIRMLENIRAMILDDMTAYSKSRMQTHNKEENGEIEEEEYRIQEDERTECNEEHIFIIRARRNNR